MVAFCAIEHVGVDGRRIRCKRPEGHRGQHVFRIMGWRKQHIEAEWAQFRQNGGVGGKPILCQICAKRNHLCQNKPNHLAAGCPHDSWALNAKKPAPAPQFPLCGHHRLGVDCPQHGPLDKEKKAEWDAQQKVAEEVREKAREEQRKAELVDLPAPIENASPIVQAIPIELLNKMNDLVEGKNDGTFQRLGQGVSRVAYHVKGTAMVVKIELGGSGCNKTEYESWKNMTPQQRVLFAPVSYCSPDGKFLVMPLVSRVHQLSDAEVQRVARHMRAVKLQLGANDLCARNMGELDGRPVVLDYGFGAQ